MTTTQNYYGYDTEFDWDRRFFIPFITNFFLYYKFVPLFFGLVINWLILFKSPTYSTEYKRCLAFYHITMVFYDIQHLVLFVPYPLFPHPIFICYGLLCQLGGPASLAMTFTAAVAAFGTISLVLLIFIRMRTIVPVGSRFHLSFRQSVVIMGSAFTLFFLNIPGFAIFVRDTVNKTAMLERPEYAWVRVAPDAIVFGEMFELGPMNIVFSLAYGILLFLGILIYSAFALAREKKKVVHVKSKVNYNATKMLMIQLFGVVFTFMCPLFAFFATLKFGMPTSNPNVHSTIRVVLIFLYLTNSMVCFSIHLLMNKGYQRSSPVFGSYSSAFAVHQSPSELANRASVERIHAEYNNMMPGLRKK